MPWSMTGAASSRRAVSASSRRTDWRAARWASRRRRSVMFRIVLISSGPPLVSSGLKWISTKIREPSLHRPTNSGDISTPFVTVVHGLPLADRSWAWYCWTRLSNFLPRSSLRG